ncbi:MAG: glycoside hydrolase family 2 TIM barrel-domain containing protein [Planctomycetota bacterium]
MLRSSTPLRRFMLAVVLAATTPSLAQPVQPGKLPGDPSGQGLALPMSSALDRTVLSLNGLWRHIPDPFDNGSVGYLGRTRGDGWWQDRRRTRPEQRIEYSFPAAEPLAVPGDWNSQRDDLFFYEGTLWYQRTFALADIDSERLFLYFGAVNRHADVWLNGAYLGSHHVGFTPFAFDITDRAIRGENSVVIRVDNRRRAEDVPAMRTDWWNYGGITRDVAVLGTPKTFIRAWETRLSDDGSMVTGWVQLDGPERANAACVVTVGGSRVRATVRTDTSGRGTINAPWPADAGLWSPGTPVLHEVTVEATTASGMTDRATDRIGMRAITTEGRRILLNGEEVFLRGICLHEEAPDRPGRAWTEDDARTLLGWAKELGCNFVRLAHYTHNEHMLRVADELGLMVWAEIPVYWVLDFQNPATRLYAETHLREMIERDRNRASVVVWSVGNENEANVDQTALRRDLAALARSLDSSRLISAACFIRMTRDANGKLERVSVEDPFGEFADVLAINEYIGWYHDSTDQLAGLSLETAWEKPLLFSEFGVGVKQGLSGTPDEIWTEEFGVRFYRDQLAWCDELRRAGLLHGLSPWILKDFRSPRRPLAGVQDWYNRKGLISETGERKAVFSVV